jgi:hypothetical protein
VASSVVDSSKVECPSLYSRWAGLLSSFFAACVVVVGWRRGGVRAGLVPLGPAGVYGAPRPSIFSSDRMPYEYIPWRHRVPVDAARAQADLAAAGVAGYVLRLWRQFICTREELLIGARFSVWAPGSVALGLSAVFRLRRGIVTYGPK